VVEHWLSDSQVSVLGSISDNFVVHGVSGFSCANILQGRPYGRCEILWNKCFVGSVTPVDTHISRIAAIKFVTASYSLLLINVYLLCDNGTVEIYDDYVTELSNTES